MVDELASKPTGKRLLTINEFTEKYGPSRTKTYELIAEGRLKSVRVDARRLIRTDDAEAWLNSLDDGFSSKEAA